ncbi:MAG: phosphonate metabolism transcriptional regulator PhnF [Acidithiobacillus sp.]|nr:phosphonate metabolism transcriptional regulator PhnF [Acidithiobacillus sp.]
MTDITKIPYAPGITIWKQIVDDIQQRMDRGEVRPGEKLPSEGALASTYGVNRHTIRRALQELAANGRLRIAHGRGSFVAPTVFDYQLEERPRFSEWIKKYNRPGSSEVLEAAVIPRQDLPELPRILQYEVFPDYPNVAMVETLGKLGEHPVSIARHLFFGERLLALVDDLQQGLGITVSLQKRGVSDYTRLKSSVSAKLPEARERRLLAIDKFDPVFICENVNIDPKGVGIEFSTVIYPASRVRLVYEPG